MRAEGPRPPHFLGFLNTSGCTGSRFSQKQMREKHANVHAMASSPPFPGLFLLPSGRPVTAAASVWAGGQGPHCIIQDRPQNQLRHQVTTDRDSFRHERLDSERKGSSSTGLGATKRGPRKEATVTTVPGHLRQASTPARGFTEPLRGGGETGALGSNLTVSRV